MTDWLAVITITIFAVISPGPDFAMVSRNALAFSWRAGVLTAIGIGAGVMIHVSYTLLGIGVLMANSPALFDVLKLAGAGYLIWLGVKMLRGAGTSNPDPKTDSAISGWSAFGTGFLTNALNPKTTVFIVSLFLQVVQERTPMLTRLGYGMFIAGAHVVWFSVVSLFFSVPMVQRRIWGMRHWIDQTFGVLLVVFGLALATTGLGE